MYWHCEIRDNLMNTEIQNRHLESKFHSSLVNSIIMRYIISNLNPRQIEDTIRRYLTNHYEKYNNFQVVLLLELIMPSNQIKYVRIQRSSYR